jgi:hypothetical protein
VVIAYFYFSQLAEMRIATQASTKAAAAAAESLDASGAQFVAAINESKWQTKAQLDAAGASQKSAGAAQSAAQTAQDSLTKAQRPWIGVVGQPTIVEFAFAKDLDNRNIVKLSLTLNITNYGSSPALHLGSITLGDFMDYKWQGSFETADYLRTITMNSACFFAGSSAQKTLVQGGHPGRKDEWFKANPEGFTIFPSQQFSMLNSSINEPYTQEDLKKPLYIFACIAYGDQFDKVVHHTKYCYVTPGPIGSFSPQQGLLTCGIATGVD